MSPRAVTSHDLFVVMARASVAQPGVRVELSPDADLADPMTKLGVALNVLLDDLEYRHRQAEANLRLLLDERTQRLRDSDDAIRHREEFISIAGHELYTPLTSLQLVLQGLRQGLVGGAPDRLQHVLELAERQSRKLAMLVDALLGVGRSQATGPMILHREQLDLAAITQGVAELFGPDLQRSGSQLVIRAEAPVVGQWDRHRLEQVLTNLLGNAIKFGAGKPIDITLVVDAGTARLTVTDHGIGIPPDRLPRIFERFERAVSRAHYGGLGLGLSIVQEIVLAHGGSVRAESVVGEGATFVVELPCDGPPPSHPEGR